MTAEFAIVLPAVLVVLTLAVGAIMIATQRVVLISAAAEVARLEARGDADEAAARIDALPPGVKIVRSLSSGLHCVSLNAHPLAGPLTAVGISVRGCAALIVQRSLNESGDDTTVGGQSLVRGHRVIWFTAAVRANASRPANALRPIKISLPDRSQVGAYVGAHLGIHLEAPT